MFLGEADPRIQEKSGMKNYNIKLINKMTFGKKENEETDKSEKSRQFVDIGILYDEGRKCVSKG